MSLAAHVLSRLTATGDQGVTLIQSPGFRIWIGIAAFSVALWLALLVRGLKLVKNLGPTLSAVTGDVVLYAAFAAAVGWLLLNLQGKSLDIPIQDWRSVVQRLLGVAALAALPWVLAVWAVHRSMRKLVEEDLDRLQVEADRMRSVPMTHQDEEQVRGLVKGLSDTWETIQAIVVNLSLIVTPAVLMTGALRLAVVPSTVPAENFPPLAVVLYGLLFAVLIAGAAVPMLLTWRSRARELVDLVVPLPPDGRPTSNFAEERSRIEKYLGLDVGYLRSPITALGVLAPFLTAAATALVPTPK